MTDIVERLRAAGIDYTVEWGSGELYDEAADEIERLRLDAARYRWLKTRRVSDWELFGWRSDTDAAIDAAMKG